MDSNIEVHGSNSPRDGLFYMKIKYKFVEKFTLMADQHHEGKLLLHRKLEGGVWKSRMTITIANQQTSPFLDVTIDSDRLTKPYVNYNI